MSLSIIRISGFHVYILFHNLRGPGLRILGDGGVGAGSHEASLPPLADHHHLAAVDAVAVAVVY